MGREKTSMSVRYAVICEYATNNWAPYVPDLPDCITTGATLKETERNIRKAIEAHLKNCGTMTRGLEAQQRLSRPVSARHNFFQTFFAIPSAT
jgi:predicted RNase H-like HicB family nuclease